MGGSLLPGSARRLGGGAAAGTTLIGLLLSTTLIIFLAGLHNVVTISLVSRCLHPDGGTNDVPGVQRPATIGGGASVGVSSLESVGAVAFKSARRLAPTAPPPEPAPVPDAEISDGAAAQPPLDFLETAARLSALLRPEQRELLRAVSDRAAIDAHAAARDLARGLAAAVFGGDIAAALAEAPDASGGRFEDESFYTHQACYLQTDESEVRRRCRWCRARHPRACSGDGDVVHCATLVVGVDVDVIDVHQSRRPNAPLPTHPYHPQLCTYENVLCFDGRDAIVAVDMPASELAELARSDAYAAKDEGHGSQNPAEAAAAAKFQKSLPPMVPSLRFSSLESCVDQAYSEPSSIEGTHCGAKTTGGAARVSGPGSGTGVDRRVGDDYSLPLMSRQWGPLNMGHEFTIRGLPPSSIFLDEAKVLTNGWNDAAGVAAAAALKVQQIRPKRDAGTGKLARGAVPLGRWANSIALYPGGPNVARRTWVDGRVGA